MAMTVSAAEPTRTEIMLVALAKQLQVLLNRPVEKNIKPAD